MTRPLGVELELAQQIVAQAQELGADLAQTGQYLLANLPKLATRREAYVKARIIKIRVLLDQIESGLTKL